MQEERDPASGTEPEKTGIPQGRKSRILQVLNPYPRPPGEEDASSWGMICRGFPFPEDYPEGYGAIAPHAFPNTLAPVIFMNLPLRLSQGSLNLLTDCPRKFQHTVLEQTGLYPDPAFQERLQWGTQFHQRMQQWELGLPMAGVGSRPLVASDPLMEQITAFVQCAPDIFQKTPESCRESEHRRTLAWAASSPERDGQRMSHDLGGPVGDFLLTVIYDLLIAEPTVAKILDWKTYPRPKKAQWLARNWQTRLYPYVLAETSDYSPDQIRMTYWFIQAPNSAKTEGARGEGMKPDSPNTDNSNTDNLNTDSPNTGNLRMGSPNMDITPQSLDFPYLDFLYSEERHRQTHQDLMDLLNRLTRWLQDYQQGIALPQIPIGSRLCESCPFALRCERVHTPSPREAFDDQIQMIAEISEIKVL